MSKQQRHSTAQADEETKRPAAIPHEDSSRSTPSTGISSVHPRGIATSSNTPQTPYTPTERSSNAATQFRVPPSPRESTTGMTGESASKAAKVAIPRLKRSLDSGDIGAKGSSKHRVTHACEPCRHRKTKCSGERPTCRHCQDFKIACYYADGKRDRVKKQFGSMQDKVADYEKILRDLQGRVSDADAETIRATLSRATINDNEEAITVTSDTQPVQSVETADLEEASGAESEVSGGRGSTGALDRTEEDFTREGANTTGFMGKNSDVTWLQRLRQENKYGEGTTESNDPNAQRLQDISGPSLRSRASASTNVALPEADDGFTVQDSSYHLNDLAISNYEAVDPYEMPTSDHGHMLFMTYVQRVHVSYPIVGKVNLQNQLVKYMARPTNRPPPKWLAIVNLIFAISARYTHLVQADWRGDEREHTIYFARARMLGLDNETIFNHPDLQMIQILTLVSIYLLSVDQVNRAWNIAGFAIRSATALGLNMRNDSAQLPDSLKEIRYRLWWAMYNLEHRLCAMTGRVNCIVDDHCTTPLPVPLTEDDFETDQGTKLLNKEHQRIARAPSSNSPTPNSIGHRTDSATSSRSGSNRLADSRSPSAAQGTATQGIDWTKDVSPNSSLYFFHAIQLSRLTQVMFNKLYNPRAVEGKWSDIQRSIQDLDVQLENWYRKLPPVFDFRRKQRDKDFYESRVALGCFYYSTKQMLHRPCLCRLDRKIPGQSNKSMEFNRSSAQTCVQAAKEQLSQIPDEPNSVGLMRTFPWLSTLHLLVQALTVLTLEISFRTHHMPQHADEIIEDAKKGVRWLHNLGEENLAAARAWRLCQEMLMQAAVKVGRVIDDLPQTVPRSAAVFDQDATMSGTATVSSQLYDRGQDQTQNMHYGTNYPATSMAFSNMAIPDLAAFSQGAMGASTYHMFDQHGTHDPHMQFTDNPSHMQFGTMPTDAEMNFMNQYTEHHDDGSGGPRGGRAGYG